MAEVFLNLGGGGGSVTSDDLTANASNVLSGKTYMGVDTDDEAGTGTMPNIAAIDNGPSLAMNNGNLYCRMNYGAHVTNASSGYPEVSYSLSTVRSAINYTDSSKVLTGTTIAGLTGTMANRGQYQYAGGFGSGSDYVAFNKIPEGYYGPSSDWAPEIRMNKDTFKTNVINYFGIASVTNFKVAQYSSQKLQFTWANPSSGMWSGIRIVGKQSGYPSSVTDGTVICDSAAQSYVSGTLTVGTWYFRAWNYVTVSGDKWYGGYSQASGVSKVVGDLTFTSSTSWTVPNGVSQIQYFLVGGGASGEAGTVDSDNDRDYAAHGGGGGYTSSGYMNVSSGQTVNIVVGAGGAAAASSRKGSESSLSISNGEKASATGGLANGNGGSGGGAPGASVQGYYKGGDGGSDGSDGEYIYNKAGGVGQHTSTRCPWDNVLYAGGGGGGAGEHTYNPGAGGSGGGGAGRTIGYGVNSVYPGESNTGGGGGGGYSSYWGADGGSGVVRIRYGY